jgi:serine/threonine protein kinase
MVGFALTRYPQTTDSRPKKDTTSLDTITAVKGVESAVKHLHSLGFPHKDLNPTNVMVDDHDDVVIIDLSPTMLWST